VTENKDPQVLKPLGQPPEGLADVRTVSTGLLLYNLMLCTATLQHNQALLTQARMSLKAQRLVGMPPQLAQLEATVREQMRMRDVMVKNLEERFAGLDEVYWAKLGIPPAVPGNHKPT
jgi:ABC-type tungstate transport system substrate-binding protein